MRSVLVASLLAAAGGVASANGPAPASPASASPAATSLPAAAKAAARKAPGGPLSLTQRERIAIKTVTKSVNPWVPKDQRLSVRTAIQPFAGDKRNPITGEGPIDVYVNQYLAPGASSPRRFFHQFNRYAKRVFSVSVDPAGEALVLDMQSNAPQYRLGRLLGRVLPLPQLMADVVHSPKMAEAGVTAVATGAAFTVNPALAGAGLLWLGKVLVDGVEHQRQVRKAAVDATVKWAKDLHAQQQAWPSLAESFRFFRSNLNDGNPGTTPYSLSHFAGELSIRGL
jgi:hypothetical protein